MTIEPWRVQGSRVTYEDEWLKVVTDSCRAADGRLLGDYHVLQYPDWVNVVALTDGGQVLLLREYRHARRPLSVGLPGGATASNEAPLAAAQRELREETGYTAPRWVSLGKSAVNAATHSNLLWSFLALSATKTSSPSLDLSENVELVLEDWSEVVRGFGKEAEVQSLHLATLLLAVRFVLADGSDELTPMRVSLSQALTTSGRGDEHA